MNASPQLNPAAGVRVTQIITFAMVAGILAYAGFTLYTRKFALDGDAGGISRIAIGFAAVVLVLHIVVPKISMRNQLRALKSKQLNDVEENQKFQRVFAVFQTGHIIACALLESAAFFNLFAFQSTGYVWNLGTAMAMVLLILIRLPTLNSSEFWVQDRLAEMDLR